MAAGDGPRDWKQDDAFTFPYAAGGIHRRPTARTSGSGRSGSRPRNWLLIFGSIVAALAIVIVGTRFGGLVQYPGIDRPASIGAQGSGPAPATYATPADEHASLLHAAQRVASSLIVLAHSGSPMPTGYVLGSDGVLRAQPGGQVLGQLDANASISWLAQPDGTITTLTLIGPTFGTRVSLNIGAMSNPPEGASGSSA